MRSRRLIAAIAALLAGGLTGCGGADTTTSTPAASQSAGSAQDSGPTSREDYLKALGEFRKCLEGHDLKYTEFGWNPVDHRSIDYTFGNDRRSDEDVLKFGDACQAAHLEKVQSAYFKSTRPTMDPKILELTHECLEGRGVAVNKSDANVGDLIRTAGTDARRSVSRCVAESAQKVYPNRQIAVRE